LRKVTEQDNRSGIASDQGDIVVPCEFDTIAHSTLKDESGRAVFECQRNGKLTYYDQSGNVFKPRAVKPRKYRNAKKRRKWIAAFAATLLFVVVGLSVFYVVDHFSPEPPTDDKPTNGAVPHQPIANVIKGNIIQIVAGHSHSTALMEDGTVWTWGDNLYEGTVEAYEQEDRSKPVKYDIRINQPTIAKVDIDNVKYVAAGNCTSAAIKNDGSLWTWGYNLHGALGNGIDTAVAGETFEIDSKPCKIMDKVESVSLGDSWGLALKKDGTLWAWGRNHYGTLAGKTVGVHSCEPIKIMDDVAAASAGSDHAMALKKDGTVWIWGDNYYGQQGDRFSSDEPAVKPKKIMDDAIQIFAGYRRSSIVKADGTIWTWGGVSDGGQVVRYQRAPLGDSVKVLQIGGSSARPLFLASDGMLYLWDIENDSLIKLMDSIIQASRFSDHLLVLKEDGTVWAWGDNDYSQLGDGTTEKRDELVLIYPKD